MVVVVVIAAATRSIQSDIDHRTAGVIAAIVISGIAGAVITNVGRAPCKQEWKG
jgi:predicted benzoate:H+ symporter BenE